ncbi:hypothetical protein SDC9_199071 [bioreactor metagenome]|uniref:Uncharacterized protein n=1 Tax=bioreactor metagenome TaxID=1076179 RepID=A0A645IK86_9ZZZZ
MIIFSVRGKFFIKTSSSGNINLTADYRFYCVLFRGTEKIDHSVHDSVIGYRGGGHPELLRAYDGFLYGTGSVEKAVFSMKMKMTKAHALPLLFMDQKSCCGL